MLTNSDARNWAAEVSRGYGCRRVLQKAPGCRHPPQAVRAQRPWSPTQGGAMQRSRGRGAPGFLRQQSEADRAAKEIFLEPYAEIAKLCWSKGGCFRRRS
ncbi:unnamed protein product [Effrenium voratum]|nr:unnamed protein product [Effrenium voratum]